MPNSVLEHLPDATLTLSLLRGDVFLTQLTGPLKEPGNLDFFMDTANPILGNPLLIAAILLFLAILPWALRQKKKTTLDRAVERFEKQETQKAYPSKSLESHPVPENSVSSQKGFAAYPKEEPAHRSPAPDYGGIPPFPDSEDTGEPAKVVKDGIPISHNTLEASTSPARKKVKLIKQEMSIDPAAKRVSSQQDDAAPQKSSIRPPAPKEQPSAWEKDFSTPPLVPTEDGDSEDNWVEAEIPGLIIEPLPPMEGSEYIPTFHASSENQSPSAKKTLHTPKEKEKPDKRIKNRQLETDEKASPKPGKPLNSGSDSQERKKEISGSSPKLVEKKDTVVSHKNIHKNVPDESETQDPGSQNEKTGETDSRKIPVPFGGEPDSNTLDEPAQGKPFFLDPKYLVHEESDLETTIPFLQEPITPERADGMIARLKALQADLENQLVPDFSKERLENQQKRRNGPEEAFPESSPVWENAVNRESVKREISLEELDSFLFTAGQKKNRE